MKRLYILPSLMIAAAGFFAFQSSNSTGVTSTFKKSVHLQAGGNQPGLTGAPGESNCTQCHSGSVLDGNATGENEFTLVNAGFTPVSTYNPGDSYTATLQLASNPSKKGFSSTTLDNATNSMAGTLTGMAIGGTDNFQNVAMTRDYVSHTSTSNTSAVTLWSWTWDAPAVAVGDVTFYIASNVANDNGTQTGDAIYLSEHVIGQTVGVDEVDANEAAFSAGYSVEGNKVIVDFNSLVADEMFFNLVDLTGKSVYTYNLSKSLIGSNKQSVSLPEEITNGIYVVHFFVGNRAMSAKVMVQK